ncbi:MAG: hypothetical protein GTO41_20365 [Burkholderiales bacterium]|nr:hypothetical protein [Burkholderiales bacterium]
MSETNAHLAEEDVQDCEEGAMAWWWCGLCGDVGAEALKSVVPTPYNG